MGSNKTARGLLWLIILILAVPLGIYLIRQDQTPKVRAAPVPVPVTQCSLQSPNPRVRNGLISTPELYNNFSNTTGTCVIDNRAPLRSLEIPSYDTLKSKYFDQAKITKVILHGDQTGGIDLTTENKVYYITGNLALDNPGDITGSKTGVIFVDGNLTIGPIPGNQLIHGNNNSGLVFVVKGNVIIASSIIQIDAVLISSGTIFTAGSGCNTSAVTAFQLVINGSLMSLKQPPPADPNASYIKFCRTLAVPGNNTTAAELIIQQPKYLVILKDIVADTLQTWSEIP